VPEPSEEELRRKTRGREKALRREER